MRIQNRLAIALAGVLLSGISALPGVKTDYEHNLDFARYHTYSWGKVQAANSLWDARIKQAVDGQLAAKGWTEVPSGAEVVLAARDAVHDQQELNTFYDGFGGRRFGGFGTATTTVDTEKVGPLIVEMFDGQFGMPRQRTPFPAIRTKTSRRSTITCTRCSSISRRNQRNN